MRNTWKRTLAVAVLLGVTTVASFAAMANWQGTWFYYDEEGALVGSWTAGCGAADGRWGVATSNKVFIQGCNGTATE